MSTVLCLVCLTILGSGVLYRGPWFTILLYFLNETIKKLNVIKMQKILKRKRMKVKVEGQPLLNQIILM